MPDDLKSRLADIATREKPRAPRAARPASRAKKAEAAQADGKWEDTHQRFTCWLGRDVVTELRARAEGGGESLSALVERLLRAGLG